MKLHTGLLLATACALTACADEARREYVYKPAYCLAAGLAGVGGSDDCMPQQLKENAAAVATAKLLEANAPADAPTRVATVYYTPDQRLAMSYDIARIYFAPTEALTKESTIMSLGAAGIIEPAPVKNKKCDADKARRDVIDHARGHINDIAINRDTAKFLAENYTDLQITELYRAAKAGAALAEVSDDAFIMPDSANPKKSINVKPSNGTKLGSILSFTTSRVTSSYVKTNRSELEALLKQRLTERRDAACPPPPPAVIEPAPAPAEEGASQ